jgi:hypothetical protein
MYLLLLLFDHMFIIKQAPNLFSSSQDEKLTAAVQQFRSKSWKKIGVYQRMTLLIFSSLSDTIYINRNNQKVKILIQYILQLNVFLVELMFNVCIAGRRFSIPVLLKGLGARRCK